MAKIHITLVGGQPVPVYYCIKALNPEKIIYIYSDKSEQEYNILLSVLDIPHEGISLDPVQPDIIEKECSRLAERFKNDEVTINISSGTKPWSYFFAQVFDQYSNASIVYIDQNNVLWDFTQRTTKTIDFDMFMNFKLYNNELKYYTPFTDYTDEDKKAAEKLEEIRGFEFNEFNELFASLNPQNAHKLKNQKHDTFKTKRGSFVEWTKEKGLSEISICLIKKNGKKLEKRIRSPHAINLAFNSGWFEYKVACLLAKWDKAKAIYMNCIFPTMKNVSKNEVDIIVNTGTKVLFVECKTQILNSTDIDKFSTVIRTFGGMGSKRLFVTQEKMNENAESKCKEQNIITFSFANSNMNIPTEKVLALLLDNELYNINSK